MRSSWIFQLKERKTEKKKTKKKNKKKKQKQKKKKKQQKVATPLLFYHSEQACLVLYPEIKYHTWNNKV